MGYLLTLSKINKVGLPECDRDFVGSKVWQHWYLDEETEIRCGIEILFEGRNYYDLLEVFEVTLRRAGIQIEHFPITEINKETLQFIDLEISERMSRLLIEDDTISREVLGEFQKFQPVLQNLLKTFNFNEHLLLFEWA